MKEEVTKQKVAEVEKHIDRWIKWDDPSDFYSLKGPVYPRNWKLFSKRWKARQSKRRK